jgi:7-cyano-7-deazaguanine synthase
MLMPKGSTGRALVLLSGGVDSAALVALFAEHGRVFEALFIDYGQPAAERELQSAKRVAKHVGVPLAQLSISSIHPDASYTGTPGRNALLVIAALAKYGSTVETIALGVHTSSRYWDCTREFVTAMQALVDGYVAGAVRVSAPFLTWSKREVLGFLGSTALARIETYSCDRANGPCGSCASCGELANARA